MTVRPALPAGLVLLAALASAAAGCSAASEPAASPTGGGPLRDYLTTQLGYGASDEDRAADTVRIQSLIAACMAAEGFDYVPVSDDDPYYRPDEWRQDDPDWVAQWGYGVTDFPGRDQMLASQAEGDANTAYYDGLTISEQAAYTNTLYGPAPTDSELAASVDGSAPIPWQKQGCYGESRHEVLGDEPLQNASNTSLRQAIQQFQATQFAAPVYEELDSDWAECMADAGHPDVERPEQARTSISDAQSAIYSSQTVTDEDDPRLDALHDEEVALALADLQCREDTDFAARSWAIQVAQEQQFIADHQAEFDEVAAEAAQAG